MLIIFVCKNTYFIVVYTFSPDSVPNSTCPQSPKGDDGKICRQQVTLFPSVEVNNANQTAKTEQ